MLVAVVVSLVRTGKRPWVQRQHMASRMHMSSAVQWLQDNGFEVGGSKSSGSSGWASFGKVDVTKPDGTPARLFVKTARRSAKEMFEGEALGLRAMRATKSIRIPDVLHYGDGDDGGSFLIMEYLELNGRVDQEEFGRQLARMHSATPSPEFWTEEGGFGFPLDNTIGGTPQVNTWRTSWVDFFRENRMDFQVKRAGDSQLTKAWQEVLGRTDGLRSLFAGLEVGPSVLHGDLWSGNMAATSTNEPVIFDPATYIGHHEAEWGMSWCASLGPRFWTGYREVIPEAEGFQARRPLYQVRPMRGKTNAAGRLMVCRTRPTGISPHQPLQPLWRVLSRLQHQPIEAAHRLDWGAGEGQVDRSGRRLIVLQAACPWLCSTPHPALWCRGTSRGHPLR